MEVIRETLWKRCLSTPTKPPAKNSNICLSETAYQHKGTRKKCKKTNQAAIIQWQRQRLMDKPHRKPWPKSKTSDISKQSPSPLHHTFLLGRARFTAQPLSALLVAGSRARCLRYYKLLRHDGEKDDGKKRGIIPFSLLSSNPARILLALSPYILVSLGSDDGEILRRQTWSRVFGVRSPSQWGEK